MLLTKMIIYFVMYGYLFFGKDNVKPRVLLARVNKKYLYKQDIDNLLKSANDKVEKKKILDKFVDNWVEKQLVIAEARRQKDFDELDLEQRLLEYKYALIVHNFLEKQISKNLDHNVSEQEVVKYYQDNLSDFELKDNIVRGRFVILHRDAQDRSAFEKLFTSKKEEDRADLEEYCIENAIEYDIDSSDWHKFIDIVKGTPLQFSKDKISTIKRIKRARLYKTKKDHFYDDQQNKSFAICYFKIEEFKILNQISPLKFVREKIIDTILHKRRMALRKKLLKDILAKAKQSGDFDIYPPKT